MSWESGYQLRVRENGGERIFPLHSKAVTIGRAGPGKIPSLELLLLDDPSVSRVHAALSWKLLKGVFMLHHKSKTNSTLVNGEPSERILLAPGDRLQMGDVVMKIEKVDAQTAPPKPLLITEEPKEPETVHSEEQTSAAPVPKASEPAAKPKQKFVWKPPEDR